MEMLASLRFCVNIILFALCALGIGLMMFIRPVWTAEMNSIIFLMVCAVGLVYGLNNSVYVKEE